jgi:hypothetical protein
MRTHAAPREFGAGSALGAALPMFSWLIYALQLVAKRCAEKPQEILDAHAARSPSSGSSPVVASMNAA